MDTINSWITRVRAVEPIQIPTLDMRKARSVSHSLHHLSVHLGMTYKRSAKCVIRYDPGYRKRYGVPARPWNPKSGRFDTAEPFSRSEPSPRCRISSSHKYLQSHPRHLPKAGMLKISPLILASTGLLRSRVEDREKCVELKKGKVHEIFPGSK